MVQNCDFHRNYHLIPQTPLIHFQYRQMGAALRASEVKPKLDRYLLKLYDGDPKEWKKWLIPGQEKALNYQMRILAEEKADLKGLKIGDCAAYFANLGNGDDKDFVFRHCRLEINCFIPELLKFLDENIGSFFVLHNFGTRQSKGFGGFLVEGFDKPLFIRQTIEKAWPHHFFCISRNTDLRRRMAQANGIYTVMKNGTNQTRYDNGQYRFRDRYIKGYAVREFLPAGTGSDKAFIKARVLPVPNGRMKPEMPYENYTFIRAMLGLADHYEFRDDMRNGGLKPNGKVRQSNVHVVHFEGTKVVNGKLQLDMKAVSENKGIKRFRSPFLIKIFADRIFFILEDGWKQMQGQTFLILTDEQKRKKDYQKAQHIRTPDAFDPEAFISGFIEYFNSRAMQDQFLKFQDDKSGIRAIAGLTLEKGGRS